MLKRWILFFFLFVAQIGFAQNKYVILQSKSKVPFFVKFNAKIISSTGNGFLILPNLNTGEHLIRLGLPKSSIPETLFAISIDQTDLHYVLDINENEIVALQEVGSNTQLLPKTKPAVVVSDPVVKTDPIVKTTPPVKVDPPVIVNTNIDSNLNGKVPPLSGTAGNSVANNPVDTVTIKTNDKPTIGNTTDSPIKADPGKVNDPNTTTQQPSKPTVETEVANVQRIIENQDIRGGQLNFSSKSIGMFFVNSNL